MQTKSVRFTSTSDLSTVNTLSTTNSLIQENARQRKLVLGCGALVYELVELIKHNPMVNQVVDLHCLPATLHNTPQLIAGEVDNFLSDKGHDYAEILVAYGDCGTAGALDRVLEKHQATRLPGAHCYEFFVGSQQYDDIMQDELGSFFLTDFLVKFFDRLIIEGLGIDRYPELKEVYFKHYKQLIYIAQTDDSTLQEKAKQCAQKLGLEYQTRFVGLDGLRPVTNSHIQSRSQRAFSNIEVRHV